MSHWLDTVVRLLEAKTSNLKELARIAGADHRTFYIGIDPSRLDLEGQDLTDVQFSVDFEWPQQLELPITPLLTGARSKRMIQIVHASRYEERIAMVIDTILLDRELGAEVLKVYQRDKSRHATDFLERLSAFFRREGFRVNEVAILEFARKHFQRSMPRNRAAIIYYLAKHLSKYEDARWYLARWLGASERYLSVDEFDEISLALQYRAEIRRHPDPNQLPLPFDR